MSKEYEFTVVRDLYKEEEADGIIQLVLVKANLQTKWFCRDTSMILSCEEHYDDNGKINKNLSKIFVEGEEKLIKMKYQDLKNLLSEESNIVGFKNK